MPQKKIKQKTIKTPIGPIWVYSYVERAVRPLKHRNNLKIITAVGAVIIILLTLLYAGFIDDRRGSKAFSGNGAGSLDDPFHISTCSQLQEMEAAPATAHYVITNDIDCADTINWNGGAGFDPIDHNSNTYVFSLDGRNHTISGLYIDNNNTLSNSVGLFASLGGADVSIKNLNISGAVVNTTETTSGILVGYLGSASPGTKARVDHVHVDGNLITEGNYGGILAGIAYIVDTKITNSSVSGGVNATNAAATQSIGGLAGSADVIENSYSTAYIDMYAANSAPLFCGGLAGFARSVVNSYATGNIDCPGPSSSLYVGGLIGYTGSGTEQIYDNNFSVAQVINNSAFSRGGLLGGGNTITVADDNYYDRTATTQAKCAYSASGDPCIAVNTDGLSPNYFKNTTAVAPLNSWDFSTTWQTTTDYPTLRTPVITPEEPTITSNVVSNTTSTISWSAPTYDGGSSITDYKIYYKEQTSGSWTLWTDAVSTSTTAIITGLLPATNYDFRVRAVNSIGDGLYSTIHQGTTLNTAMTPSVTTLLATEITQTSAKLNGITSPQGVLTRGFEWGTSTNYSTTNYDSTALNYSYLSKFGTVGVAPGEMQSPHDVAIDSNGNYFVVDNNNDRIEKFSPDGNFLLLWGSNGSGDGQFDSPVSIEIDSSDNIYIVDRGNTANHRIQKFDVNGNFISKFGTYGTGNGQIAWPLDMAIDANGDIYVTNTNNHRIEKFDANGNFISNFGTYGTGAGQFYFPRYLDIDSLGNLYITDTNNRIQKFNSAGVYTTGWGTSGSGNGQFNNPTHIAIDSADNIYVTDTSNHRVQKFDSSGSYLATIGSGGNGDGQFYYPRGITISNGDTLYIADTLNNRIQTFTSPITLDLSGLSCSTSYHFRAFAANTDGTSYGEDVAFTTADCDDTPEVTTLGVTNIDGDSATFSGLVSPRWLATRGFQWGTDSNFGMGTDAEDDITTPTFTEADAWGEYGTNSGQTQSITAIEHDSSQNTYILDTTSCKVSKFDVNGNFLLEWGSCGSASGQLLSPRAMTIDIYNNIYVADTYNHRVQKFDSEGNYMLEWGSQGIGDGQFSYVGARGIAVDNNGVVYVSDINANRIQAFDSNGNYLYQWGSTGTGFGQFITAFSLATDSNNYVYVNDLDNDRIQKFFNGSYVSQWGSSGTGDGQFSTLSGIEVDSNDNIYAVDNEANRIQKFNPSGVFVSLWGTTGNGANEFQGASDISFDRHDNAFVADTNANLVKKFSYGISFTTANNLLCGTDYYVRAFSTTNNNTPGSIGQTVSFSTSACPGTPPMPPENLAIIDDDGITATLDWDPPANSGSSPVSDYLIEFRRSSDLDWTPYPNTVSTSTAETVTSLEPGATYYFRVYAVSDDGTSGPSNEVELSYEIDVSMNTVLLNSGEIKAGDTVTYRNTITNNGPGTTTLQSTIPASLHILPVNFSFSTTNSSTIACADWNSTEFAYLAQFYPTDKIASCLPITNTTLAQGESVTFDIIGTADSDLPNNATMKSFGVNFYDAHREKVEFYNQLNILTGIFVAFGGDLSQPSSSTDIFTLPFNNISISTYNYTAPTSTPTPSPTVTTSTTPSPPIYPSTTPSSNPSPSPTNQPEPKLPNPLFPKYPPAGVKVPKVDTPPATSESNFLTGFIPEGILNTIRMTPNAVALALPFFIILVLIALAVLYARQAWLEYRTIAKVRSIIERYHSTKEASQNFVALTSHYLNTPVNILQASTELLVSTKSISRADIDKLNLAIANLAEDIKKLVTESQKTTSRVAESTTELDKLRLKNPLLSIFVIVPSGIVILILFILNLLFTAADRYSLSFALIVAQITALILGIGLLALSWHSYKRNQASRDALKHQLTLEADILARRVAFITQSYSDLNADLGLVKALTKDISKTNPAQKTLQNGSVMLEDVLKKFGRLINFSRPLETLPAPVSIAPVIESALNTQKNAIANKKIIVKCQIPVNITAPLTQEAVEQLINSIIDNAVKFNKDGGSLKVYTKNTKRGTTITFVDSGIGIDTAKLSQLMTPFSRATDVLKFDYEGIGLNLYLDKVLFEQVGGELQIASTQNKGTTITLRLPEVKR